MLIVDAQIHLWEKGTPSLPHRQEPYSAEQAIAAMDEAGVDRALIHPVAIDRNVESSARFQHRSCDCRPVRSGTNLMHEEAGSRYFTEHRQGWDQKFEGQVDFG